MELKLLGTVFVTIFLAELGDKTQLATMLFASESSASLLAVFLAASAALVAATAIGVLAGAALGHYIQPRYLSWLAGAGFIAIGAWTLWRA